MNRVAPLLLTKLPPHQGFMTTHLIPVCAAAEVQMTPDCWRRNTGFQTKKAEDSEKHEL